MAQGNETRTWLQSKAGVKGHISIFCHDPMALLHTDRRQIRKFVSNLRKYLSLKFRVKYCQLGGGRKVIFAPSIQ